MGTVISGVATTCLVVCLSIIFTTLIQPPQAGTHPVRSDRLEVPR
jgi:hypothetical protein